MNADETPPSSGARRLPERAQALLDWARATEGFLPLDEAMALFAVAARALRTGTGPLIEIGSYLGRSTLFLAAAIAAEGATPTVVFSVDHHRGSEEMQPGWPDHDPALVDPGTGRMDTLRHFRARIEQADAEDLVVGVVGDSARVAANWSTPACLVFIDGGHGATTCWADYRGWAPKIAPGGFLVFHDVFADPRAGGRPPYECYRDALTSTRFVEDASAGCRSLRVLRRADGRWV
ncbi:MAG TPA: class I SAM-dependent methyltransferase [Acidimicrobiales bacterium]|nr:class I SAM-dependent methyltransferase [Acidimicrobiales bacterium]